MFVKFEYSKYNKCDLYSVYLKLVIYQNFTEIFRQNKMKIFSFFFVNL